MLTVGILLPRSTYYAGIGFDFFEGFQSALRVSGRTDIRVVTENIGFGTDKQLCYKSAEQLLMHANASVVFAYISHRTAQLLRPLFTAANRLLVVLDSGANLVQEWPESPNIYYHSLHNSLGTWLSARKAFADGRPTAAMVTGYYDGGYLQTFAAYTGFSDAGGTIGFNLATGYTREDFSMEALSGYLQNAPESCVLAIFSGDYVQWFLEELAARPATRSARVYLPPFAFEESVLNECPHPGNELSGIAAWASSLDNDANRTFVAELEQAGRTANLFSLLGWEAAQLFVALSGKLQHPNNGREAGKALRTVTFESPRGTVRFHETLNCSLAPLYEARIVAGETGNCTVIIDGPAEDTDAAFDALTAQPLENAVSGWHNSYTCI